MRVAHWSLHNGSGMANVALSMVESEKRLGLDSFLVKCEAPETWDVALDADVHVSHTHFPKADIGWKCKPNHKVVWVGHGTPEHVFQGAVQAAEHGAYAPGNSFMLIQYWLQHADARVTFWPRHKAIYDTMVDKGTVVDLVPLGVDTEFWAAGVSKGKYQGDPSVWTGENAHYIKWPLDLFLLWPWVIKEVPRVQLHACYLGSDVHKFFFPLIHRNGAYFKSHVGAWTYPHSELRNVFKSIDYFIGLVRYGDFNRICMEANAAGVHTISYPGNPYSAHWVSEGDQRETAKDLIAILKGDVEVRPDRLPPPDFMDSARAMNSIYERICD